MEAWAGIARLNQKIKRLSTLIEANELISSFPDPDTIPENGTAISRRVPE